MKNKLFSILETGEPCRQLGLTPQPLKANEYIPSIINRAPINKLPLQSFVKAYRAMQSWLAQDSFTKAPQTTFDYLSLFQIILFLFAAIPYAIPFSYQPNPVFLSELASFIGIMALVFAAGILPSRRNHTLCLPLAMLPWIGLMVTMGIQLILMPTIYWSGRLYPVIYGFSSLVGILAFSRAKNAFGMRPLVEALAWGLLAGALFNTCISAQQVHDLWKNGTRLIYGHIGQKNMYGHYLAWGFASTIWLVTERKLPQWIFWLIASWFALSMAWCGSRSVLTYAIIWLFLGFFITAMGRDATRRFGFFLCGSAILILFMQLASPFINDILQQLLGVEKRNIVPTGLDRFASNGARRLVEWQKAWITFTDYPLLGLGWGLYPAQSVALQVRPEFAKVVENVLFTHCHNSVLNVMAETGIVGVVLILGSMASLLWGICQRWQHTTVLLGISLLSVSILHSLVEYPLWYFHFLGPFAIALFLFCDLNLNIFVPRLLSVLRYIWIGIGLSGIMLAIYGSNMYSTIHPLMGPTHHPTVDSRRIKKLNAMRNNLLVDYYAEFALSNYIIPNKTDLEWKLAILRRLNSVRPYPTQLLDNAILEALDGNINQAHQLIRYAAYAFPENLDDYYSALNRLPPLTVKILTSELDDAAQFFMFHHGFKKEF